MRWRERGRGPRTKHGRHTPGDSRNCFTLRSLRLQSKKKKKALVREEAEGEINTPRGRRWQRREQEEKGKPSQCEEINKKDRGRCLEELSGGPGCRQTRR